MLLSAIAIWLYGWVEGQKLRQRRVEELLIFLQRTAFAMETEKIHIIEYLEGYHTRDALFEGLLRETAGRLRQNIYPCGEMVWEEVFREKRREWNCSGETFELILRVGVGLFGKSRSENTSFLRRSIRQLEEESHRCKERDIQERKVWIPVGMLGGMMLVIILI